MHEDSTVYEFEQCLGYSGIEKIKFRLMGKPFPEGTVIGFKKESQEGILKDMEIGKNSVHVAT